MLDVNDMRCQNDLLYIDGLFKKFERHAKEVYAAIDALLNAATLLPLCKDEYEGDYKIFRKYEQIYVRLKSFKDLLESYDIGLKLSSLLQAKLDNISEEE